MENYLAERAKHLEPSAIEEMIILSEGIGGEIVNLAEGDPDFKTPEHIIEAAKKAMDEGFTHYTSTFGILELREAVAEKLERENKIELNPKNEILITSGTQEAMFITALTLLNHGDEALVLEPYYPAYVTDIELAGAVPVPVPLKLDNGEYMVEEEILESHVTPRTKMIWFCNPSNPTGHVFSRNDLEAIVNVACRHKLLIFVDEIYEKIIYEGRHLSIGSFTEACDRTITLNGFSKSYAMTGWRIGYIAAHRDLIEKISSMHYYTTLCPSSVSQKAALAALTGPQEPVREMVKELKERRRTALKALNRIKEVYYCKPRGAFYIFADFSRYEVDDVKFAREILLSKKVLTVPGSGFGKSGGGYLRISYSCSRENLIKGITLLQRLIEERDT